MSLIVNGEVTIFGVSEVGKIRKSLGEIVDTDELRKITEVQEGDRPADWTHKLSVILNTSQVYQGFIASIGDSDGKSVAELLPVAETIDYSLPWCVRPRWFAGDAEQVDLFLIGVTKTSG